MDFAEVSLLMRQFIERKRAEAGQDDSPIDTLMVKLLEVLERIRNEKKQPTEKRPEDSAGTLEVPAV